MDVGWVYTIQESMRAYAANVYTSVTEELSKAADPGFDPGLSLSRFRSDSSPREEGDKDYAYSITTRVPGCLVSRRSCHRLEQSCSLGPLQLNAEVVLRTSSSLRNNRTLYTDDNGDDDNQMMKRTHRRFTNNTLARNYFPMVRAAYIQDDLSRLALVSDRAHGVSSQANGQLEVMLHRRLRNNLPWNLGYNLTLDDVSAPSPTLWMTLGAVGVASQRCQRDAVELQHRPVVVPIDRPESSWQEKEARGGAPLLCPVVLPPNLHLLSLSIPGWNYSSDHDVQLGHVNSGGDLHSEPDYDRVLLRITHLFEEGEDPELSKPVVINLKDALQGIGQIKKLEERSLTGTWDISRLQRWKWKTAGNLKTSEDDFAVSIFTKGVFPLPFTLLVVCVLCISDNESFRGGGEEEAFTVTISAKEIRTFFVHFASGNF
ncbi:LOW QUALITY PROTEIN: epididymis-specific alpha-mannosidase [Spinachia spinachia]